MYVVFRQSLHRLTCSSISPISVEKLLRVNARKEVYVLSDESVIELDINKLHVAKEMCFPRVYSDKWKALGSRSQRQLSADVDGHFEVKQARAGLAFDQNGTPIRRYFELLFKRTKSGSLLEYVGKTDTTFPATYNYKLNVYDYDNDKGYYAKMATLTSLE